MLLDTDGCMSPSPAILLASFHGNCGIALLHACRRQEGCRTVLAGTAHRMIWRSRLPDLGRSIWSALDSKLRLRGPNLFGPHAGAKSPESSQRTNMSAQMGSLANFESKSHRTAEFLV